MLENHLPKISCIVNTYNRPDLVIKAIDSILCQTYGKVEVIVIDDCSSEDYSTVLDKFGDRIIYHRNKVNRGLSASRNEGVDLSSGELIAFLDDDDVWLKDKLDVQLREINIHKGSVACSSSHIESESNKVVNKDIRLYKREDIYKENLIGPPSKLLVKREVFLNSKFDESLKHAEDWDFYLSILKQGSIVSIESPLIIYNTGHFERMTNGFSKLSLNEIKEKARATYKNRDVIGEYNFQQRMMFYYMAGFPKRKNKISHVFEVIKDLGFMPFVEYFRLRFLK